MTGNKRRPAARAALSAAVLLASLLLCACVPDADEPAGVRSAAPAPTGSRTAEAGQGGSGSGSLPGTTGTTNGGVELPMDPF